MPYTDNVSLNSVSGLVSNLSCSTNQNVAIKFKNPYRTRHTSDAVSLSAHHVSSSKRDGHAYIVLKQ